MVSNTTEWILDIRATRNFCANKDLMHVFMGNAATAGVMGKGKVLLNLLLANLCD